MEPKIKRFYSIPADLRRIAANVLSYYIESGYNSSDRSPLERLNVLAAAGIYADFNIEVKTQNYLTCINIIGGSFIRFHDFLQEIKNINRNGYELKIMQIVEIILCYKKLNKKWYQFWK